MAENIIAEWNRLTANDPEFQAFDAQTKEIIGRKFLASKKDQIAALRKSGNRTAVNSIIAAVKGGQTPEQMAAERQLNTVGSGQQQFESGTTNQVLRGAEYLSRGRVDYAPGDTNYVPEIPGAETAFNPSDYLEQRQAARKPGHQPKILSTEFAGDVAAGAADMALNIPLFGASLVSTAGQGNLGAAGDLLKRSAVATADPVELAGSLPGVATLGKAAMRSVGIGAAEAAAKTAAGQVATNAAERNVVADQIAAQLAGGAANTAGKQAGKSGAKQGAAPTAQTIDGFPVMPEALAKTTVPTRGQAIRQGAAKMAGVEAVTEGLQEGGTALAGGYGDLGTRVTELQDQIAQEANPARKAMLQAALADVKAKGVDTYSVALQGVIGAKVGAVVGGASKMATNQGDLVRQRADGSFLPPELEARIGKGLIAAGGDARVAGKDLRRGKGVDQHGYVGGHEKAAGRVVEAFKVLDEIDSGLATNAAKQAELQARVEQAKAREMQALADYTREQAINEALPPDQQGAHTAGVLEPIYKRYENAQAEGLAAWRRW